MNATCMHRTVVQPEEEPKQPSNIKQNRSSEQHRSTRPSDRALQKQQKRQRVSSREDSYRSRAEHENVSMQNNATYQVNPIELRLVSLESHRSRHNSSRLRSDSVGDFTSNSAAGSTLPNALPQINDSQMSCRTQLASTTATIQQQLTRSKSFAQFLTIFCILSLVLLPLSCSSVVSAASHHNHHHHHHAHHSIQPVPSLMPSIGQQYLAKESEITSGQRHLGQVNYHHQQASSLREDQIISGDTTKQQQQHLQAPLFESIEDSAANQQQQLRRLGEALSPEQQHHWIATLSDIHHATKQQQDQTYETANEQQMIGSSTTPSLNQQLIAPSQQPFYEFGLMPTSALQLEPLIMSSPPTQSISHSINNIHNSRLKTTSSSPLSSPPSLSLAERQRQQHFQVAESIVRPSYVVPNGLGDLGSSRVVSEHNLVANNSSFAGQSGAQQHQQNRGQRQLSYQPDAAAQHQARDTSNSSPDSASNSDSSNSSENDKQSASSSQDQSGPATAGVVDKSIEPRQRRRLFNRILKKAEWNYLFLELSKVFLRYFLDLALKDIIGKQSGASSLSGSSSDSSTTGRKKLDAQSELADLLRDFIKTAISNI